MWETTGGSVLSGENTLHGALRETREELGVSLDPEKKFIPYTYLDALFKYVSEGKNADDIL